MSFLRLTSLIRQGDRIAEPAPPAPTRFPGAEVLGGSVQVRFINAGGCNDCAMEVSAAFGPVYDVERYGALGPPVAASPDGSAFFTVQPPAPRPDGGVWPDARYLSAYGVGGSRFWVTRFNREALRGPQKVHVIPGTEYWAALRQHAEVVIIDSPSADRSQAGLAIAQHMDQTVLVVSAQQPDVKPPAQLRDALAAAGGRCAGVFFNQVSEQPPAFPKAILP